MLRVVAAGCCLLQMQRALEARTWGLRKLRAVLGMLDARLADIVGAWEDGRLAAQGLSR